MWILCSILCALIVTANGYSSGAPSSSSVCRSMMPRHPGSQMLTAALSGYKLAGESEGYELNQPFPVRIENSTATDQKIHGFLLTAREEGSTANIGEFTARGSTLDRWVQKSCDDTTLTHTGRLQPLEGLNLIEAYWNPPMNFTGRVKFSATIVIHKDLIYLGLGSDHIQLIQPRPTETPEIPPSETPTAVMEPGDPITEAPETERPVTDNQSTEVPTTERVAFNETTTQEQVFESTTVNDPVSDTTSVYNETSSENPSTTVAQAETTSLDPESLVDVEVTATSGPPDVETTVEVEQPTTQIEGNKTTIVEESTTNVSDSTTPDNSNESTTIEEVMTTEPEEESTATETEPPLDINATAPNRSAVISTEAPVTQETIVTDEPTVDVVDHTLFDEATTEQDENTKTTEGDKTEKPHEHEKPHIPDLVPLGKTKDDKDNAGSTLTCTGVVLVINSLFTLL